MQKYILAIDHGTTSTRAVLFDKAANVVEIAQKENDNILPASRLGRTRCQ